MLPLDLHLLPPRRTPRCGGAGRFGAPSATLLKACCWAVWPTPTIRLLRIGKRFCGTGNRIWIGRTTAVPRYGAGGRSEEEACRSRTEGIAVAPTWRTDTTAIVQSP